MADHPPQYADDELLNRQLEARDRASREDAAVFGRLRSLAAARALGLPIPPDPDPDRVDLDPAADLPLAPTDAIDPFAIEESVVDDPTPGADLDLEISPEQDVPLLADTDLAADQPAPAAWIFAPPDVQLPRGGPAAVTTGVLAAAAAQKPKAEKPLLELRPTVLATEIDRIGDQLVVMTDRLELRDRHGGLRRQLAHSDIEEIIVERRLTSAVLHVKSRTATDMVVKGLRPDLAEEAQAAITALLPDVPVINSIEERALMHSILALHRAGVLNDEELASKTAYVARMAGH